jgi:hypothetical protein
MTTQQIAWASKHDWFIDAVPSKLSNGLRVHVKDDMLAGNTLVFTDFDELTEWAGY